MELNSELKQKLTERFLRSMGNSLSLIDDEIIVRLLDGRHIIDITYCGKYTISEIKFKVGKYDCHFIGTSARNPNDPENRNYGIKIAVEKSLLELLSKFYNDNMNFKLEQEWGAIL